MASKIYINCPSWWGGERYSCIVRRIAGVFAPNKIVWEFGEKEYTYYIQDGRSIAIHPDGGLEYVRD